ncbi:MAG TPA: hypothetical protein V6D30_11395 [Leptolyngbyaceae cyanobacterium]
MSRNNSNACHRFQQFDFVNFQAGMYANAIAPQIQARSLSGYCDNWLFTML